MRARILPPGLPVGPYSVRVEKEGLGRSELGNRVNAASTVRVDVTYGNGPPCKTIESAPAPKLPLQESAKTSVTVNNQACGRIAAVVGGTLRQPLRSGCVTPEAKNIGGDDGSCWAAAGSRRWRHTGTAFQRTRTRELQVKLGVLDCPIARSESRISRWTYRIQAEYGHASGGVMTFCPRRPKTICTAAFTNSLATTDLDANVFSAIRAGNSARDYKQPDFGLPWSGHV